MKRSIINRLKTLESLCLSLLILASSLFFSPAVVHASEADLQNWTVYIGEDERAVTALLHENGQLEISGYGKIRDFSEETAPFAEISDAVTSLKINEGIISIGEYTFYGLGSVKGVVELPASVETIGSFAFSGGDETSAPKPSAVINHFTDKMTSVYVGAEEIDNELTLGDGEVVLDEAKREEAESQENAEQEESGQYELVTIVEQVVGESIFFPIGNEDELTATFVSSDENISFIEAMEQAGYARADGVVEVGFDNGVAGETEYLHINMPIRSGSISLPNFPTELSCPSKTELYEYVFKGYIEADDEVGTVRTPQSEITAEEGLHFISIWEKEALLEIEKNAVEDKAIFKIPEVEGYEITEVLWEEATEKDEQGNLLWQKIDDENSKVYERQIDEDEINVRASIRFYEQQSFRALRTLIGAESAEESLMLKGVSLKADIGGDKKAVGNIDKYLFLEGGEEAIGEMEPKLSRYDGAVIIPLCEFSREGYVFGGWQEEANGKHLDPGEIIHISENTTLFAKWIPLSEVTVSYITGNSAAGSPLAITTAHINALKKAGDGGTIYNNYLVVVANHVNATSSLKVPADIPFTITSIDPKGVQSNEGSTFWGGRYSGQFIMQADVRLENVTFLGKNQPQTSNIAPNGNVLTIGANVKTSHNEPSISEDVRPHIFCADTQEKGSAEYTAVRIFSGEYLEIYGVKSYYSGYTGDIDLVIAGDAIVEGNIAATTNNAQSLNGEFRFTLGDEARAKGNVYGGGNIAEIMSDPIVNIYGGTVEGNVYGAGIGAAVNGDTHVNICRGEVLGDVYGGGDLAAGAVRGSTTVNVSGGHVAGNVYGGGDYGNVTGNTQVFIEGTANVEGEAYGGGSHSSVGGESSINITGGRVASRVYGGGYNGNVGGSHTYIESAELGSAAYGGGNEADTVKAEIKIKNAVVNGNVFAGGRGTTSSVTSPTETAKVTIEGSKITGNVFGGCNQGYVEADSYIHLFGDNEILGSVYAGGNLGEVKKGSALLLEGGMVDGSVYGGASLALVDGDTDVAITGGTVKGNVCGGSYQGSVSGSTKVIMTGGNVQGNVFGGSVGDSEDSSVGAIAGNVSVKITGGYVGVKGGNGSENSGCILGGGKYARVSGDSSVYIDGSDSEFTSTYAVIGGGLYSQVRNSSVKINDGATVSGAVFGGGYGSKSALVNNVLVEINGSTYGTDIFGGGALGIVTGNIDLKINGGTIQGSVYGAGRGDSSAIASGLYGNSREEGDVYGNVSVEMNGGVIKASLYGGGDYGNVGRGTFIFEDGRAISITATIPSRVNTLINSGKIERNVYAGGSGSLQTAQNELFGSVFGDTALEIGAAEIVGSVFGGGNRAYVSDNTKVIVAPSNSKKIVIGGSVFGGGNFPSTEEPTYKEDLNLVFGSSKILLDDSNESKASTTSIGGSLIPSGNLTNVANNAELAIVGFNGAIKSIQRATDVYIVNSDVLLDGAETVLEEGTKFYSIRDIYNRMYIAGRESFFSTIRITKDSKTVSTIGSYSYMGTAENMEYFNKANYEIAIATENMGNKIELSGGRSLSIQNKNEEYGMVYGSFRLCAREFEEAGVSIQAAYNSSENAILKSADCLIEDLIKNELIGDGSDSKTSHRLWRLGSDITVTDVNVIARNYEKEPIVGEDGMAYASQIFNFITSYERTVFLCKSFSVVEGTGVSIVDPEEIIEDDDASNTFALTAEAIRLEENDPGTWETIGSPIHYTYPPATIHSKDRAKELPISTGTGTGAGNNGAAKLELRYNPNFDQFENTVIQIVFEEHKHPGDDKIKDWEFSDDDLYEIVVVNLTIESEMGSGITRNAYIAKGKQGDFFSSTEPPTITGESTVTARFMSKYYPESTGSSNMNLSLLRKIDESYEVVDFPVGTEIVMADIKDERKIRYYSTRINETGIITLNSFTEMGPNSNFVYPGPGDNTRRVTEDLAFEIDFSLARDSLVPDEYFLCLRHTKTTDYALDTLPKIGFNVVAPSQEPVSISLMSDSGNPQFKISNNAVYEDTRFDAGMVAKLTLLESDGETFRRVPVGINYSVSSGKIYQNMDATLSLFTTSNEVEVTLDFSNTTIPKGMRYYMQVSLFRVGYVGNMVSFNLVSGSGETPDDEPPRAIRAALQAGSERLLDIESATAVMKVDITTNSVEGDYVQGTVQRKEAGQYVPVANSNISCEVASNGDRHTATVTAGQNAVSGTYRIVFAVCDENAAQKVSDNFTFIIK